jgi:hypothetical protein
VQERSMTMTKTYYTPWPLDVEALGKSDTACI